MTTPSDASWRNRLVYLMREIDLFFDATREYKESHEVTATATLRERNRLAVWRLRVKGEPFPADWIEEVRDIVGRARAILDNAMFTAVEATGVTLNSKQRSAVYFPIAKNAGDWTVFTNSAHAAALSQDTVDALRALQPFVSGSETASMLTKANNDDKHKKPLTLAMMPDPLFVMDFDVDHGGRDPGKVTVDWFTPARPVANGDELARFRSETAMIATRESKVPVALCIDVAGDWIDIQDFLWDIQILLLDASTVLGTVDPILAEGYRALVVLKRQQLDAFRRMILNNDRAAESEWLEISGFLNEREQTGNGASLAELLARD